MPLALQVSRRAIYAWLLGVAFCAVTLSSIAAGTPRWHWSNPLPFGNNIADLIGDTNRFYLAVADHGQAYLSEDLTTWSSLDTGTRLYLRSAFFHPLGSDTNAAVITGEAGLILRLDGNHQISRTTLPTQDWLEGVTSSGTRLVAVGDNAAIFTSDDGTNWLRRAPGITTWLRGVAWRARTGGGTFVAVGEGGQIITSPDGITWTRRTSGTSADLNRVVTTPTGFMAVGAAGTAIVTANDGQRWTALTSGATDELFAIGVETRTVLGQSVTVPLLAGAHELRSGVSLGGSFLWTDELDTRRTAPAPVSSYYAAIHDGTRYLIGGQAGLLVTGQRSTGIDQSLLWTPFDSPPRAVLWGVTTATSIRTNITAKLVDTAIVTSTNTSTNTGYAAIGYGPTFLQSDNGSTWTTALAPAAASNVVFLGVSSRADRLIAVGSGGHIAFSPLEYEKLISTNTFTNGTIVLSVVLTNYPSTLGLAWQDAPSGVTNELQGIAVSPSLFVATGGGGTIITSSDGLKWIRRTTPAKSFMGSVAFGPAGWVSVGELGTLWTSPDGTGWTARASGTTNWLWRVRQWNGQYIAVGQSGTILVSTNATTWTPRTSGVTNWLYDIENVGGTFYCAGSQGTVLMSSDTVAWTVADTITGKPLYGLAGIDGQLIAVGSEGVILRSQVGAFPSAPALTQWPGNATNSFFLIQGHMDQRLRLERSVNLTDWVPGEEIEITSPDGSILLYDATANALDTQLFRAAERP